MYADQISTGRKPSVHERLDADRPSGRGGADPALRARQAVFKRQRQTDDKWKHDLYREDNGSASRSADPRDLRFKLQRKNSQQGSAGQKVSGVRDLREKLSGTMHPQPSNADLEGKPVSEVVKVTRRENADERPVRQSKKVAKPSSSKKTSQPKAESPIDNFLKSLGLEKYSVNFQAEEVDMAALRHMTESDLKALGIRWVLGRRLFLHRNPEFRAMSMKVQCRKAGTWGRFCSSASSAYLGKGCLEQQDVVQEG